MLAWRFMDGLFTRTSDLPFLFTYLVQASHTYLYVSVCCREAVRICADTAVSVVRTNELAQCSSGGRGSVRKRLLEIRTCSSSAVCSSPGCNVEHLSILRIRCQADPCFPVFTTLPSYRLLHAAEPWQSLRVLHAGSWFLRFDVIRLVCGSWWPAREKSLWLSSRFRLRLLCRSTMHAGSIVLLPPRSSGGLEEPQSPVKYKIHSVAHASLSLTNCGQGTR